MNFCLNEDINLDEFNIDNDLDIIESIFNVSKEELFNAAEINSLDTQEDLNKLYNYCYKNKLYINEIKWQECVEIFNSTNKKVMCHGSRYGLVGKILPNYSDNNNDFGKGFYIGETLEQAGMFVSDSEDSSIYIMLLNLNGLNRYSFRVTTNWMFAVAYYRGIIKKYEQHPKIQNIIKKLEDVDVIIAPIADNRVFQLIDAFINNELTDKQTLYALSATHLGYQYVLKTEKAIENLKIIDHCFLCSLEKAYYNKLNIIESNTSLNKAILAKKRYEGKGLYLKDILK